MVLQLIFRVAQVTVQQFLDTGDPVDYSVAVCIHLLGHFLDASAAGQIQFQRADISGIVLLIISDQRFQKTGC